MGETCLHVPARVFGFESNSTELIPTSKHSPGLAPAPSLLSALLKGSGCPPPSASYMSDAYSESEDEDMMSEGGEEEEEDGDENTEDDLGSAAEGGTPAIPIPAGQSEAYERAQKEVFKRLVYAVQIEEMRRQCAQYFARQERHNPASTASFNTSTHPSEPTAMSEANVAPVARAGY